jgi:hypothetical protein
MEAYLIYTTFSKLALLPLSDTTNVIKPILFGSIRSSCHLSSVDSWSGGVKHHKHLLCLPLEEREFLKTSVHLALTWIHYCAAVSSSPTIDTLSCRKEACTFLDKLFCSLHSVIATDVVLNHGPSVHTLVAALVLLTTGWQHSHKWSEHLFNLWDPYVCVCVCACARVGGWMGGLLDCRCNYTPTCVGR